ncbi:hypothetical protein F5X96DRAFT_33151 [Biscogniauxia mediterranea]|nr:hypothetical protein F5X96DRAFT_33151 [Biscogniauxia mediterranea]
MLNHRGPISKLVGGAIGLTQEYRADRKEKKAAAEEAKARTEEAGVSSAISSEDQLVPSHSSDYHGHASPSSSHPGYDDGDDDDLTDDDDDDWVLALDEAQQAEGIVPGDAHHQQQQQDGKLNIDQFVAQFIARHPPPPTEPAGRLPMPVILPQRRPESRHRGFVRAYAPVLGACCGIDQATWLEFLDGIDKSIDGSSWFHVLNAAVAVGGHVNAALGGVSLTAFVAFTTVHLSLETGRRAYIHYQQNQYLDALNARFFQPRGLYCLVIKYKPSSDKELSSDADAAAVDLRNNNDDNDHEHERHTTRAVARRDGQGKWKNLVAASAATTTREAEIPARAAALVFPGLDALDEGERRRSAVGRFGDFLADYYDRQAGARFEAENKGSRIPAVPRREFASRYSDPNHPASTGGLVAVATGGRYDPVGPVGRVQRRWAERRRRGKGKGGEGEVEGEVMGVRRRREKKGPLKKVLKQDALYLMVVNMPSPEEMERARAELELERAGT